MRSGAAFVPADTPFSALLRRCGLDLEGGRFGDLGFPLHSSLLGNFALRAVRAITIYVSWVQGGLDRLGLSPPECCFGTLGPMTVDCSVGRREGGTGMRATS